MDPPLAHCWREEVIVEALNNVAHHNYRRTELRDSRQLERFATRTRTRRNNTLSLWGLL